MLVGVDFGKPGFSDNIEEMRLLASSAGAELVAQNLCRRAKIDSSTFIGSGKALEIAALVEQYDSDFVLFAHALSPAQQRNLEGVFKVRVVDRVALILDIFALRAQSHEGKLQVELAQLQHLSTRLVRMWSHLERQRGGIGMRGPGESQLEMDKRIIGDKIRALKERLEKLRKQRQTQRRGRARAGVFTVSVVGYTNAGKSSLFNQLTKANTYAADQLFATLDTTSRKLFIDGQHLVMSDTVGFIRELPTTLVAAFRATLEEALNADLLVHVIDMSSPERDAHIAQVNQVLAAIGVQDIPQLRVYNKCDLLDLPAKIALETMPLPFVADAEEAYSDERFYDEAGEPLNPEAQDEQGQAASLAQQAAETRPQLEQTTITLSAKTGLGLDLLRSYLAQAARKHSHKHTEIEPADSAVSP